MYCAKCQHDLQECTCEDLAERVESLAASPFIYLSQHQLEVLREQGRKNKEEKAKQE